MNDIITSATFSKNSFTKIFGVRHKHKIGKSKISIVISLFLEKRSIAAEIFISEIVSQLLLQPLDLLLVPVLLHGFLENQVVIDGNLEKKGLGDDFR